MRSICSFAVDISLWLHFLRVCFKCVLRNSLDSVETVVAIGQHMISRFSGHRSAHDYQIQLTTVRPPIDGNAENYVSGGPSNNFQAPFGVVSKARHDLIHLLCFTPPPFQSNKSSMSAQNR